jgi:putative transposase
LVKSLYSTQRRHPDWYFHKINTGDDHVHLLMEIPPCYSVAAVVQELKSCSSSHLRRNFKFINELYNHSGIWSVGYFASTIGLNEDNIRRYIERQSNFDAGVDVTVEIATPNSHE